MAINLNGNHWVNSDNMGKKLLVKAGWSSGEGIGKAKQGTNDHIKVSIKNEKQGIGMKVDKRQSGLSLMQTVQFDNLLKTKYCKPADTTPTLVSSDRSLSRPRYGRAVRQDYFDPIDRSQWNGILCSAEPTKTDSCKTKPVDNTTAKSDRVGGSSFFTSSQTVFEYFYSKSPRNSGTEKVERLQDFLRAQVKEEKPKTGKRGYNDDGKVVDVTEETPNKKLKMNVSDGDVINPIVVLDDIAVEGERRKSKKKTQIEEVKEKDEKEEKRDRKSKTKRKKQDEDNDDKEEDNCIVEENDTMVGESKKNKKRKSKIHQDGDEVVSDVNMKKKKKRASENVQEQVDQPARNLEFEIIVEKSKKNRKSKNFNSSVANGDEIHEENRKTNSAEISDNTDIIDSELVKCKSIIDLPSIKQSVVSELTEWIEPDVIDPWTTSSIGAIPGYVYY